MSVFVKVMPLMTLPKRILTIFYVTKSQLIKSHISEAGILKHEYATFDPSQSLIFYISGMHGMRGSLYTI